MLIRPPVVRDLRHNLWAKMTASPDRTQNPEGSGGGHQQQSEADVRLARLKELGELKASGVLTEEEFAAEKARILG